MNAALLRQTADGVATPSYVFDTDLFRERSELVREVFGDNIGLCYSIKANPFLLCALATGTFLTWYSSGLSVPNLKMYMGILLILIALFMLFAAEKVRLKPTIPVGCSMGVLSGVMNGFFAIGGPPVALYLLPAIDEKLAYIATANAYFFLFKIVNLPLRFTNGSVGTEHIGYIIAAVVSMTLGTFTGEQLVMLKMDKKLMSKLVYGFVIISGLIIVIQEALK